MRQSPEGVDQEFIDKVLANYQDRYGVPFLNQENQGESFEEEEALPQELALSLFHRSNPGLKGQQTSDPSMVQAIGAVYPELNIEPMGLKGGMSQFCPHCGKTFLLPNFFKLHLKHYKVKNKLVYYCPKQMLEISSSLNISKSNSVNKLTSETPQKKVKKGPTNILIEEEKIYLLTEIEEIEKQEKEIEIEIEIEKTIQNGQKKIESFIYKKEGQTQKGGFCRYYTAFQQHTFFQKNPIEDGEIIKNLLSTDFEEKEGLLKSRVETLKNEKVHDYIKLMLQEANNHPRYLKNSKLRKHVKDGHVQVLEDLNYIVEQEILNKNVSDKLNFIKKSLVNHNRPVMLRGLVTFNRGLVTFNQVNNRPHVINVTGFKNINEKEKEEQNTSRNASIKLVNKRKKLKENINNNIKKKIENYEKHKRGSFLRLTVDDPNHQGATRLYIKKNLETDEIYGDYYLPKKDKWQKKFISFSNEETLSSFVKGYTRGKKK